MYRKDTEVSECKRRIALEADRGILLSVDNRDPSTIDSSWQQVTRGTCSERWARMLQVGSFVLPRCGKAPKPSRIDDCGRRKTRTARFLIDRYTIQISLTFKGGTTLERIFRHSVHFNFPACPTVLLPFTGPNTLLFLRNQCLCWRRVYSPFCWFSSALVTCQSNHVFSFLVIEQTRHNSEAILSRKWFVEAELNGDFIEGQKILLEHCCGSGCVCRARVRLDRILVSIYT